MKGKSFFLAGVLALAGLAALPARAGSIVYNNDFGGVISGDNYNLDAWTINFGYSVADSFSLSSSTNVTGFNLALWAYPGDTLTSLNWYITTSPLGGTTLDSGLGVSPTTQTLLETNGNGYNVYEETFSISPGLALSSGTTYWLQIDTADVLSGNPIYWDQSDGPSTAYESAEGLLGSCDGSCTTGSESFQILGDISGVPEPGTLALLGGGLIALAGFRRLVK